MYALLLLVCATGGDLPPGSEFKTATSTAPATSLAPDTPPSGSDLELYDAEGPELILPLPRPESIDPPAPAVTDQQKAYLFQEGQRQESAGKVMLYIGIPLGIVGTALGLGGMVTIGNGRSPGGSAVAILSGFLLGLGGGGGIIAGSILVHRGRKKMERGQPRPRSLTVSLRF